MHTIDIVLLVVLAIGLVRGYTSGLIRQVAGVAGLLVGFVVASQFNETVGNWLGSLFGLPTEIQPVVGFAVVFVGVLFAASLLVRMVEAPINALKLTPVNRVLGAALGIGKSALLASVALAVLAYGAWPSETAREEAALYEPIRAALPATWDFVAARVPAVTEFAETVTHEAKGAAEDALRP